MAPEQVADARQAPDRADIYALGVVLFEMIVGSPPFMGGNPRAILVAKVLHAPPSLVSVAPHVPEALSGLVGRCIAKTPDERPTASTVCDELLAMEKTLPEEGAGRVDAAHKPLDPLLASTINEDQQSSRGSD
ncbi:MAG: protein kinase [Myxococcales bacterium]|jgi:serine/threonine protein kinase|nr:protein kinase [Myxococcales bacterium]